MFETIRKKWHERRMYKSNALLPVQSNSLVRSLVVGRQIAAAAVSDGQESCKFGTNQYFLLCGCGGIFACGTTHLLVVPLDLVKCRIQVDPSKYKGIFHGFKLTLAEEGAAGLTKGWAPTLFGYAAQGFCKFGLYEAFKVWYSNAVGEEAAYLYRTYIYISASATAEFIADIALSPMETVKVKIQTMPGFAGSLREAWPKIMADGGIGAFYRSLVPLWFRQIPYTIMKFVCFEKTVVMLYKNFVPKPREECSKGEQLVVTFAAGYIAGVFCAVVSHPADTLVSKLSQGNSASQVLKELGFLGLWKGLVPRIVMIGTLTALQWFIYDAFKVATSMPRPPPPEMPASLKKKQNE